jgi:hypothetical protein
MTRIVETRRSKRAAVAFFIRRSRDGCSVIELHPDDREQVVESGLALADAENLCGRKMDEMRRAAMPLSLDLPHDPGPRPELKPRRGARQLAFKF